MKTTYFSHFIDHIKICQLRCCFLETLTQQGKIYGINVSDGPNKSHLYIQDIPVVQKCYLFVFSLKQLKDSLKEGSGLELLFIKVHPEEKCLPGFHDDKSLDRNITWLVMDNRSQNPRSPSQLSAPRSQIPDPRSPPLARGCCWGGGQAWVDRASLAVSSC